MTFLKFRVCGFSSPSGKLAKIARQVKHTPLICTKYILLYLIGILINQYCKNKRWNTCEKSMKRAVYPHKSKDQEKNRLYRIGSSRCALHRRLELALLPALCFTWCIPSLSHTSHFKFSYYRLTACWQGLVSNIHFTSFIVCPEGQKRRSNNGNYYNQVRKQSV